MLNCGMHPKYVPSCGMHHEFAFSSDQSPNKLPYFTYPIAFQSWRYATEQKVENQQVLRWREKTSHQLINLFTEINTRLIQIQLKCIHHVIERSMENQKWIRRVIKTKKKLCLSLIISIKCIEWFSHYASRFNFRRTSTTLLLTISWNHSHWIQLQILDLWPIRPTKQLFEVKTHQEFTKSTK